MLLHLRALVVPCPGALLLTAPPSLSAPVSAGNEALLIRHARNPRVPRRWLAHARHADAAVRAAAARALTMTGVTAALGPLRMVLAAGADSAARAEQALALIALGVRDAHPAGCPGRPVSLCRPPLPATLRRFIVTAHVNFVMQ